jgi:hypothetical protein
MALVLIHNSVGESVVGSAPLVANICDASRTAITNFPPGKGGTDIVRMAS